MKIIKLFRECINRKVKFPIIAQKLNGKFDDLGRIDLTKNEMNNSLDDHLAKIFYCSILMRPGQSGKCLFPFGMSGAKITLDDGRKWPQIYKEKDAWLEIKGAFPRDSRAGADGLRRADPGPPGDDPRSQPPPLNPGRASLPDLLSARGSYPAPGRA